MRGEWSKGGESFTESEPVGGTERSRTSSHFIEECSLRRLRKEGEGGVKSSTDWWGEEPPEAGEIGLKEGRGERERDRCLERRGEGEGVAWDFFRGGESRGCEREEEREEVGEEGFSS